MLPDFVKITKNMLNPGTVEAYFAGEKPNSSWGKAALNFAIVFGIGFAIKLAEFLLGLTPAAMSGNAGYAIRNTPVGFVMTEILVVVTLAMSIALIHLLARFFGGKGDARELAYLYSLSNLGLFPLTFILSLAIYLPIPALAFACVFGLIGLVIGIYGFFLLYKIAKVVYALEMLKSAAAVILGIVISTALYLAVAFLTLYGMPVS